MNLKEKTNMFMQLYRLRVKYQLQNKESGQMYCIKRKKKKKKNKYKTSGPACFMH